MEVYTEVLPEGPLIVQGQTTVVRNASCVLDCLDGAGAEVAHGLQYGQLFSCGCWDCHSPHGHPAHAPAAALRWPGSATAPTATTFWPSLPMRQMPVATAHRQTTATLAVVRVRNEGRGE